MAFTNGSSNGLSATLLHVRNRFTARVMARPAVTAQKCCG